MEEDVRWTQRLQNFEIAFSPLKKIIVRDDLNELEQ